MLFRVIFWSQGAVEELEVFFSREERILRSHPNAGDNVILYETTQGFPRGGHEVLIIRVRDVVSLRARDLVLWHHSFASDMKHAATHDSCYTYEESVCSSLFGKVRIGIGVQ